MCLTAHAALSHVGFTFWILCFALVIDDVNVTTKPFSNVSIKFLSIFGSSHPAVLLKYSPHETQLIEEIYQTME